MSNRKIQLSITGYLRSFKHHNDTLHHYVKVYFSLIGEIKNNLFDKFYAMIIQMLFNLESNDMF